MGKKYFLSKSFIVLLIICFGLLSKIVQFTLLPAKYFFDSNKILALTNGANIASDISYNKTASFFKAINIFEFTSLIEWAVLSAIIGCFILIVTLTKNKKTLQLDKWQLFYFLSSLFLINIYVFNISKDIIQFLCFLLMFITINHISKKSISLNTKIATCCICYLIIAFLFRKYYALMAGFTILIYYVITRFRTAKKITWRTVLFNAMLMLICVFATLIFISIFMPEEYEMVLAARSGVNMSRANDPNANTIILDLINANGNLGLFMANYVINALRMMFPIELLVKGVYYWPFVIYQILVTYFLVKSTMNISKNTDHKTIMYICVCWAYFFVSFIFEPDFGSWVRHESSAFLIIFPVVMTFNRYKLPHKAKQKTRRLSKVGV